MQQICKDEPRDVLLRVEQLIMATKPDSYYGNENENGDGNDDLVTLIRFLDCKPFYENNLIALISNFKLLLKEFQFLPYNVFVGGHLEFFKKFATALKVQGSVIDAYCRYVTCYRPKIGIYVGSFNPFHVGHMSVLKQADRLFDKVIVAYPKENPMVIARVEDILPFHEVVGFEGLLVDHINTYRDDVTLIRGLRNGEDLSFEVNLRRAYADLGMNVNMVYLTTDLPHVSSSMVREIAKVSPAYETYIPRDYNYAHR
jgi:pantetheine-phosphate adenylyltransferase